MNGPNQILDSNSYSVTDIHGSVKLRTKDEGARSYEPVSIPFLLKEAARLAPSHTALGVKRDEKWIKWTYSEYLKDVECAARAFIKLGLEERRSVAIMGFNSPEWFISDIAAIFCNGTAVGIYPTNSPTATKHIAAHCRANVIVVEDDVQLQKILKIKSELPDLKAIVQYTGIPVKEGVLSWSALMKLGQEHEVELQPEVEKRLSNVAINQCCVLVYTSGTTGNPKGVMMSHDNLSHTARILGETFNLKYEEERFVSYLPLSHVAANLLDVIISLNYRGTTYFADKNALKGSLNFTLKEVLPTVFFGVPRVWEKIQEKMMEIGQSNKGLRRQIGNWAKMTGLKRNKHIIDHSGAEGNDSISYKLANHMVFQKVKIALGLNKCHLFLVGAAPFSINTFEYFLSLDIRIMELYGMSESSGPHTLNDLNNQQAGSVGKTMLGCDTKIDDRGSKDGSGEICMRGRHIMMGYLENEEKTAECLENSEDGWLKSGDVGVLDKEGFLTITGRIKEIIVTAGGENVPPVMIEDAIKNELPCVSNALVIGDKKKFLSCLLTLKSEVDPDTQVPQNKLSIGTQKWLAENGITDVDKLDELLDGLDYSNFAKAVQKGIDEVNKHAVSNAQKVQKWAFVRKDFSVAGGELGPTMKVKRHVITQQYEDVIEKLYN